MFGLDSSVITVLTAKSVSRLVSDRAKTCAVASVVNNSPNRSLRGRFTPEQASRRRDRSLELVPAEEV